MASKAYGFSKERGEGLSRLLDASATLGQSNRGKMFPAARIAIARAPSGGIAARSGTTPGSATCGLYELSSGSLVDSGITETVYNVFSSAIANNAYVIIAQDYIGGDWYVISEDCV